MKIKGKYYRWAGIVIASSLCLPISGCNGGPFHYRPGQYTMCQVTNQGNWHDEHGHSEMQGSYFFSVAETNADIALPFTGIKWLQLSIAVPRSSEPTTYDPSDVSIEVDDKKIMALPRAWYRDAKALSSDANHAPKKEATLPLVIVHEPNSIYLHDEVTIFLAFPVQLPEHATFRINPGYITNGKTRIALPVQESCYKPGHIDLDQRGLI
jgi:hypothetical protein